MTELTHKNSTSFPFLLLSTKKWIVFLWGTRLKRAFISIPREVCVHSELANSTVQQLFLGQIQTVDECGGVELKPKLKRMIVHQLERIYANKLLSYIGFRPMFAVILLLLYCQCIILKDDFEWDVVNQFVNVWCMHALLFVFLCWVKIDYFLTFVHVKTMQAKK